MSEFKNIMNAVKNKPQMYLSGKTINALSDFITGYLVAKENSLTQEEIFFKEEFYHFIKEKNRLSDEAHWKDLLLKLNKENQESAFQGFFYYFKKFNESA